MPAVKIRNLVKTFGKTKALNNISVDIEKGKITGLTGADGSGKTTLIRLIVGLILPDQGETEVLGLNPYKQKKLLMPKIGYMPQKFGLYEDLTVKENLELFADLKNVKHNFKKLLEFTGLEPFQTRQAKALSGGMKQKLALACILQNSPEFLLLDEPSVGVDPISRKELLKTVKEMITEETTVLWSSAYLDETFGFDKTIMLDKGNIIFNSNPEDLAKNPEEFEKEIIKLMGGYTPEISKIAQNYTISETDLICIVEADNLEKKYGDFYAVKNNSFCIRRGEIFGLLGPNGAGKSTSFKMMCGLLKPTSGTASVMGVDIRKNPEKARENLGYMAQKFSLYGTLTVKENLEFFASVYGARLKAGKNRIEEIIEIFNFQDILNMKSQDLPLGFKQRLSMACALIHNPPVLFLDEPTSGVDVIARKEFWNHITSLAKKGATVLITTHFMDEAEYCDRISLFYKGETVATGTPLELKTEAGANDMENTFINLIKRSEAL